MPETITEHDALVLDNLRLQARVVELQRLLHVADMRARYDLHDGDEIRDGVIARSPLAS